MLSKPGENVVSWKGLGQAALRVLPIASVVFLLAWWNLEPILRFGAAVNIVIPWAHRGVLSLAEWRGLWRFEPIPSSYEEIAFLNSRGLRLSGWWIDVPQSKGTIVLAHGSHVDKRTMLGMARLLNEGGYSTFLFDFTAYGNSQGWASSLGLLEAADVAAAAEYLRAQGIDRVGVYGMSMGAAAAIMAAADSPGITAVVADSPYADLEDLLDYWGEDQERLITNLARLALGVDLREAQPAEAAARISPRPILIIGGANDRNVPPSHFRRIYDAAKEPKELWLVPAAAHAGAMGAQPEEYRRRILEFFDQYLKEGQ